MGAPHPHVEDVDQRFARPQKEEAKTVRRAHWLKAKLKGTESEAVLQFLRGIANTPSAAVGAVEALPTERKFLKTIST